jgi:pilus assembly protein CpaB
MRASSILVILIGLGVAGGSVYAARDYVETQATAATAAQVATVTVLVASRDIPLGQPIEAQMVTTQTWPVDAVPMGVITDQAMLLPDAGQELRRARRAISQGELFTEARVGAFGEKITIAQTLAPNARAVAISVDAQSSVGGFVTPGDFVDIVMTQTAAAGCGR